MMAIAEELNRLAVEKKVLQLELSYFASSPYDEQALFENNVTYHHVSTGKRRHYFSFANYIDILKMVWGSLVACAKLFWIYPDIVVGKGGGDSFPVLFGARILGIPVIIHESDSIPGRVNRWASKFAKRIAVSYPDALEFFPKEKTAWTGQPIRRNILKPTTIGAREFLHLQDEAPVILVIGGSQGSMVINDTVVDMLLDALPKYQIIHQVGKDNLMSTVGRAEIILRDAPLAHRYQGFGYLNATAMAMSAGVASLVISRAGSTIFEIANWGIPSIIIPIPADISHDQEHNALAYAKSGACMLLKQENLTPHILLSEIDRLIENKNLYKDMAEKTKSWGRPDAAHVIALEIIKLGLEHER